MPALKPAGLPVWRRPAAVLLAAVLVAALTARMGLWQLDRAAQKRALAERIQQRGALPRLDAHALARDAASAAEQHQRRVVLHGRWLAARTLYLDNRQMNGRPGFFVLTPLELVPGDAVLVQRGWIPRDPQDRTRLAPVRTPDGEVAVFGRIAPPPSALFALGAAEDGTIRQNLDLPAYAREIGVALRPLSVVETGDTSNPPAMTDADGLLRQWPQPSVDVGKHHGYAFQWFAMCALTVGLYVWFQILRPRRHAPS